MLIILLAVSVSGCSVLSREVRTAAEPRVSFQQLMAHTDRYEGKTVILGGYIIETRNFDDRSEIKVLQTPLMPGDEPKARKFSQGRFTVTHEGFLDPEVYLRGRRITVAGTVTGRYVDSDAPGAPPYPAIKSREMHVWVKYNYWPYGYPYDRPYYHPFRYPPYYYRHGLLFVPEY